MEHGMNNKYLDTKSQKLSRIVPIKNLIIDKIDENQNIKRLCRYMTTTPLLPKGKTYDGKIINQPDLTESLKVDVETKGEAFVSGTVIYPYGFTEDVVDRDRLTIYVYCPRTILSTDSRKVYDDRTVSYIGNHLFYIDVVFPLEYNNIEPYGEERAYSIAYEILDMFDDLYIEDDYTRDIVGDIRFKVEGEILNKRLSVTNYAILSIPLYVPYTTVRVKSNLLER